MSEKYQIPNMEKKLWNMTIISEDPSLNPATRRRANVACLLLRKIMKQQAKD